MQAGRRSIFFVKKKLAAIDGALHNLCTPHPTDRPSYHPSRPWKNVYPRSLAYPMDIHTLLMLLAAVTVIWLICAPHKQIQDDEQKVDSKHAQPTAPTEAASSQDLSIPL